MGGKPAARLTDMHTCPQFSGLVPHVGGPVVKGSPNVLVNGRPAARVGDIATCNGPADAITEGSATVFINGRPAARMGDGTAHGGVVVTGSPDVFIGNGVGFGPGLLKRPCPLQAQQAEAPFYDPSASLYNSVTSV